MKGWVLFSGIAFCAIEGLAERRPAVNVEAGTYSQYIWRGMVVTNGPVLQTSSTVSDRGYHLNVFTNLDLGSVNQRRGKFSEVDYDAGYDRLLEKATLSAGLIHYTFPNTQAASTTELYAGAALAAPLHPSAKVYVDVGAIDGTYATFDISHALALPKPGRGMTWSADFTAGLGAGSRGFGKGYYGVEHAGFADFHSGISLPVGIGRRVHVSPRAGYSSVVDSTLRRSEIMKAHNFYFGLCISLVL